MPLALFALTIAAYAIGTTEFVIVGLLPTVADDLGITLPLAGLIVSIYALGVTFGAPVLTALTGRAGRKPLLLGLMALFIAGNTLAAFAHPTKSCSSPVCCRPSPTGYSSPSARRSRPNSCRRTGGPRPSP